MTERMFNSDQEDYMRSLSETHPSKLCYCGWHSVGSCSTYHDRRTSLDKLNDWLEKPCVCPSYCEHCRAKKAIAYWNEKDAQPAPLTDEQRAREWLSSNWSQCYLAKNDGVRFGVTMDGHRFYRIDLVYEWLATYAAHVLSQHRPTEDK